MGLCAVPCIAPAVQCMLQCDRWLMLGVLCCHALQEEEMAQKLRELQASAPKGPRQPQVDHLGRAAAVGGRKTSVARVSKAQGAILVSGLATDGGGLTAAAASKGMKQC